MAGLGGGDENALELDRGEGLCNLVHIYIFKNLNCALYFKCMVSEFYLNRAAFFFFFNVVSAQRWMGMDPR